MLNENKVKAKEWQSNCFSILKHAPCQGLTLGVPVAAMKSTEIPLTPAQNKLRNLDIVKQLRLAGTAFISLLLLISLAKKRNRNYH